MKPERVGFFSGTFDPVHVGHIEFVLQAIDQANLKKVYILVEEIPREKSNITPLAHRIAMVQAAIKNHKNIELLAVPAKTFNVPETLPYIQNKAGATRLAYLCGSDIAKTFIYRWPGLELLTATADILIGLRADEGRLSVQKNMEEIGYEVSYEIIDSPKPHLASTSIRNGTHSIEDIDPRVAQYIKQNNLYS
jgi:nicotinate-nucleotide adenylyltransferase